MTKKNQTNLHLKLVKINENDDMKDKIVMQVANPTASDANNHGDYWIRVTLSGYSWVLLENTVGVLVALHIPETDNFNLLCVLDNISDAKHRVDRLCSLDGAQWAHFKSRDQARKHLRKAYLQRREYTTMLRKAILEPLPFIGVHDKHPRRVHSKLSLQYGFPTDKWPRHRTIDIWRKVLEELDKLISDVRHGERPSEGLLKIPSLRDLVVRMFVPLDDKDLRAYVDKCLGSIDEGMWLDWKKMLRGIRNVCAHEVKYPQFGLIECLATRGLVSLVCDIWEQGNVPLSEHAYDTCQLEIDAVKAVVQSS